MDDESTDPVIEISDFTVEGGGALDGRSLRLRRISLSIREGELVVFGGESGSGKSLLCEYVSGIARSRLRITGGRIRVAGRDVLARRAARPTPEVSYLGRDPQSAFNPHHTVERSLREFTRLLSRVSRQSKAVDWNEAFYAVGIVEPERVLPTKISELPLMMLQRLALMRALLSRSRVIVCDEATAGLDRVAESQFIDLITQIREERKVTFVLGMGRLRNAERFADRIFMFFEGGILESGPAAEFMSDPSFRYTREFLAASPRLTHSPHELQGISSEALVEAEEVIHGGDGILVPGEASEAKR